MKRGALTLPTSSEMQMARTALEDEKRAYAERHHALMAETKAEREAMQTSTAAERATLREATAAAGRLQSHSAACTPLTYHTPA